ncbi:YggS family pyridoxal phosphate-dependent enzyme [Alkalisalibacterium limincola]|uniref:Pyridoxal phosphate homeostasis protein n=2 Tax=Alkalisalibacterium limincola TaxID=2699169 RepID=A0A5C8KRI1_9GAMM|nr:YggS family pyridoxal phosphate-dependent enzyme [Alkalisalibacterium limincola]
MNLAPESPPARSEDLCSRHRAVLSKIENAMPAGGRTNPTLLAVSKTQDASRIRALAACGQRRFGENYVQEALAKQDVLADLALEWHLIGPLQSNKAKPAAERFDWIQSVDRDKLVHALARHRPLGRPPLNILIQVNIDDEDSKSGCAPGAIAGLADAIASHERLRLRGLMAIPEPHPDPRERARAFEALRRLQADLAARHPGVDTLSMGMSGDFELAIAHGATLVRVGTALFGPRAPAEA